MPRIGKRQIAENSLREALRQSGIAADQLYLGIRQKSLDELETSLLEMRRVYAAAPGLAAACRKIVIQAKDRARFAARNPKAAACKRAVKEEMLRWMLVWLEDPSMFEPWVRLRKKRLDQIDRLDRDRVAVERPGDLDL
ncbi:MAG: hypothetical protein M3Y07_08450 [Acidobacteriota bacterium]|nr:hypothetical protein [Acidobacteriota bacterium]